MKTISLPEDVHKQLVTLKLQEGNKTAADLIDKLMREYKKKKLDEARKLFRKRMDEKGLTISDILSASKKAREEIYHERFAD